MGLMELKAEKNPINARWGSVEDAISNFGCKKLGDLENKLNSNF